MATQVGQRLTKDQLNAEFKVGQTVSADQFHQKYSGGFPTHEPQQVTQSFLSKVGNTASDIGGAITSSEQTLGKGLATSIRVASGDINQSGNEADQSLRDTIATIQQHHRTGNLTPAQRQMLIDAASGKDRGYTAQSEIDPGTTITNRQLAGATAGTALDVAAIGSFGGKGAKAVSTGQKVAKVAKNVAKGASQGYAFDVATNLGQDKSLKDTVKPGLATIVGGAAPLVNEGIKAGVRAIRSKAASNAVKAVDELAGKIVQGKPEDVQRAKAALSDIPIPKKVTYKSLTETLDGRIEALSNLTDKKLPANPNALEKLTHNGHNYVSDALDQLDNYFQKTNDVQGAADLEALQQKATTTGLSAQEVNRLAKAHGIILNGFNANGELASGLNKVAAENTRKGLKDTVRSLAKNPAFEAVDKHVSDLIRTRDLAATMEEKVNALNQKIQKRGLGAKVGQFLGKAVDKVSGGILKGLINYFIPRGEGLKTLNALDLEKNLGKNLKKLQKLTDSKASNSEFLSKINSLLNEVTPGLSTKNTSAYLKEAEANLNRTNARWVKKPTAANKKSYEIAKQTYRNAVKAAGVVATGAAAKVGSKNSK